jgi:hypothetical protein
VALSAAVAIPATKHNNRSQPPDKLFLTITPPFDEEEIPGTKVILLSSDFVNQKEGREFCKFFDLTSVPD